MSIIPLTEVRILVQAVASKCVLVQRNPRNMLIHLQARHQAVAELLVADFTYRLAACVDGAAVRSFAAGFDAV